MDISLVLKYNVPQFEGIVGVSCMKFTQYSRLLWRFGLSTI